MIKYRGLITITINLMFVSLLASCFSPTTGGQTFSVRDDLLQNKYESHSGTAPSILPEFQSVHEEVSKQSSSGLNKRYNGSILESLPLSFEPSAKDASYPFIMRGSSYHAQLKANEIVIIPHTGNIVESDVVSQKQKNSDQDSSESVQNLALHLRFPGANASAKVVGLDELPGKSNYFIGSNPDNWRTSVPNYAHVAVNEIYSGINLIYYGHKQELEFDFIVAPGADPSKIQIEVSGADSVELNSVGDLALKTPNGVFKLRQPRVYQMIAGEHHLVDGRYVLGTESAENDTPTVSLGSRHIGFQLAAYDTSIPLVIDPVLNYASRIAGNSLSIGEDIAVDDDGNVYITGVTRPLGFPGANGNSPTFIGSEGGDNVFVIKLADDGATVLFSTFLGSTAGERAGAIAIDDQNNVYLSGRTSVFGQDFPITADAFKTTGGDLFITKLDSTGSNILYSTFLGGNNTVNHLGGLAVSPCGTGSCIYIVGGSNFGHQTTANAFQQSAGAGAFLSVLDPGQLIPSDQLIYSTYLGGSGRDDAFGVAVDSDGNAYISGTTRSTNFPLNHAFDTDFEGRSEAFMAKIDPSQSGVASLIYSTYIGGERDETGIGKGGVAVDSSGIALVTGSTGSFGFPVTPEGLRVSRASLDAFFVAIDPSLPGAASLLYGTFIGGSSSDQGTDVAAGPSGIAYITGFTLSNDLPGADGNIAPKLGSGLLGQNQDAFVVKIDWTRVGNDSLIDAAYVGGTEVDFSNAIAVDDFGNAYITGRTNSNEPFIPSLPNSINFPSNTFVAKINTVIALPTGTVGTASTDVLSTNFGTPPYSWTLFSGTPPAGLLLAADGTLSGVPTELGSSTFTVEITDTLAATHQQTYRKNIGTTGELGDILIRKGGSTPVPGRVIDYYILLRNTTNQTLTNVEIFEINEPWFTFISSVPAPTLVEQRDYLTSETGLPFDFVIDRRIEWTIPQIGPGELKVISYKVRLTPDSPLGVVVEGGPACKKDGTPDCEGEFNQCIEAGFSQCETICYLEEVSKLGSSSLDRFQDTVTGIFIDSGCVSCIKGVKTVCKQNYDNCKLLTLGRECSETLAEGGTSGKCCDSDPNPIQGPIDPNDKNVSSSKYIPADETLGYTIRYENIGNIEAQDIFITDILDTDVDLSKVQVLKPLAGLTPLPVDSTVTIFNDNEESWNVTLDSSSRTITWELINVNLAAGASDTLFFVVQTLENLPSGTEIRNTATIQFEIFDILTTNETLNIVDLVAPSCLVNPLPTTINQQSFSLSWSGTDPLGELDRYTLYRSMNGGPFTPFFTSEEDTSTTFTGEFGNTYAFFCLAQDTAGNVETQDSGAETTTTLEEIDPLDIDDDADGFTENQGDCDDSNPNINPGAFDIPGNGIDEDCSGSDAVALTAIDDLLARPKSGKVALVWTPVSGALSYDIYRSLTQGNSYELIETGHVTDYATYTDFNITNGLTYYYVVRSLGPNAENSANSNEVSATPSERRSRR